jgi:hypothetical protein
LVVTSSGSVISTGEPMVNVDEHTPYPPQAIDVYTESKASLKSVFTLMWRPDGRRASIWFSLSLFDDDGNDKYNF